VIHYLAVGDHTKHSEKSLFSLSSLNHAPAIF
jgi:hypothetical protein